MDAMVNRVVCFDIGGVLAHLRPTWRECAAAAGLDWSDALDRLDAGRLELFAAYQSGALGTDQYLASLSELLGGLQRADAIAVHEAILLGPVQGTEVIVDGLRAQGTLTGCLSNTNELHWQILRFGGQFPAIHPRLTASCHLIR